MDPSPSRAASLLAVALLAAGTLSGCGGEPRPADLVLRNGVISTVDSANPEAQAMAARDDTIVAVGTDAEIEAYVGPETRVIDLRGRRAVPGFVESHGHFMGVGQAQMQLDLTRSSSWSEIAAMVDSAADAAAEGEWILGRGWHQEKFDPVPERTVEGFPTHHLISRAAPDNPVYLTHASGHASIANRRAMELAGVDAGTAAPEGGEIIRDGQGRPTGVFVDAASRLIGRALQEARSGMTDAEREERARRRVRLAAREALSKGVTSFHDQGAGFGTIRLYRRMAEAGELPIRLYAMVSEDVVHPETRSTLDSLRTAGTAGHFLAIRSIGEVSADGALGSRSAWMLEPYDDLPSSTGLNVTSMERVRTLSEIGLEEDYQMAVHAIGDRANRETLDLFADLFEERGVAGDSLRWRIEHAQHLHPDDIPRFAELGVIASMQGIHACSDAPYVHQRLGQERARQGAYVWKALWESGAVVTNGTDAPVEDVDPIPSFHCTVTREIVGATGDSAFYPSQSLTREQALRSYTVNGAFAAFQDDVLGSLEPGKLADVVVLSRDIMTVPEDSIRGTRVDFTIVDGRVVYSSEEGFSDESGGADGSGEAGTGSSEARDETGDAAAGNTDEEEGL